MRVLIATDAWRPQVNGVVRSLEATAHALSGLGVNCEFVSPDDFGSTSLPSYPEVRLSAASASTIERIVQSKQPDAIHIATEGPIGLAARRFCRRRGCAFTTSYCTRFPEYLRARAPVPLAWSYAWLRWFHNASAATMVSTDTLRSELAGRGFERLALWSRGVDIALFRPRETRFLDYPRPIFISVGRLAVEKNLKAFLELDLPGTKVVVGDGPERASLQMRFPAAVFMGMRSGEELAKIYAAADIFVFSSKTDTYGIVLLEALASGCPVAAFPVPGPLEALGRAQVAVLHEDLGIAAKGALGISREKCRDFAATLSWERCAKEFLGNLVAL